MRLNIIAYRQLQKVAQPVYDQNGILENNAFMKPVYHNIYNELICWQAEGMPQWQPGEAIKWSENCLPGSTAGLDAETVYTFQQYYTFYAGSHNNYNWWCSKLKSFAASDAFDELINFTSCKGILGPIVSCKLYADFTEHHTKAFEFAKTLGDDSEIWFNLYCKWLKAFAFAAQDGALEFN